MKKFFTLFLVFLLLFESSCLALSLEEEKKQLEEELKKVEEEIARLTKEMSKVTAQKESLKKQIAVLNQKVETLKLEIKKTDLLIKQLNFKISDTSQSITQKEKEIEKNKQELSQILRSLSKQEERSLFEILLFEDTISGAFDTIFNLKNLSKKLEETLKNTKEMKQNLEKMKETLEEEKDEMESLMKIKELQKLETDKTINEKKNLLEVTKGQESEYQKLIKEKQKRADEIRKRIFELVGIAKPPTFEEAYRLAKYVESITNVRAAFLLAVLTQESNLGKNIGQCYLTDPTTGEGKRINTGAFVEKVMHPTRDVPHFLQITLNLNRDWKKTPVSCPMGFGWGGAMGPAQFIPSTWVKYQSRIMAITGSADPWNIRDAFVAAGLLLADAGAGERTLSAEWKAAMIYFSGTVDSRYSFYGNSVIAIAKAYEEDIKTLEKVYGSLD
jgi:membrane-bound lytic murein transglycosylase B